MKKKLLATLVITVVILTTLFTCVSCSSGIFEKNGEREYHQVIATVNYEGMSKDIYRGQLLTYVGSYAAAYQQNYGMSLEEVVEYFYNSLTQNALVTLYAKDYALKAAKAGNAAYAHIDASKSAADLNKDPANFLTLPEIVYSIEAANASLEESYTKIYDELYAEKNKEEETEEETSEDELEARTVRSYTEEAATTFKKETIAKSIAIVYGVEYRHITYADITESFVKDTLKTDVASFINSLKYVSQIDAKIKAEADKDIKSIMKSAKTKLLDNISNNYMSIDEFMTIQMDATILQSYRDNVKNNQTAVDADVNKLYEENKKVAVKSYLDKEDYASALGNNTFTLANQSNKYVGVKSILLKFSDEQTNALTAIKTMFATSTEKQAELRNAMALGFADSEGVINMLLGENAGIKVNVSNPLYNADEDKLSAAYTDKDVSFAAVLAAMADNMAAVSEQIVNKYKESINYDALSVDEKKAYETKLAIVEANAKKEAFTQWLYLVNDDPGMFSSDSYLITPNGEDSSYVAEYTVLGRMLSAGNLGTCVVDGYDTGVVSTVEANYTGTTEVLKTTGTSAQIYVLENQTSATTSDELKSDVYTLVTDSNNAISFIVNDFGIHVIMVTEKYGCSNFVDNAVDRVDENGIVTDDDTKVKGYVYNKNYIYEQNCTIKYDYTYTAVAEGATFDENTEYFTWAAGEFVKEDITAFAEGKVYYTRAWELQSVKCEEKTYAKYLEETVTGYSSTNALTKDQISILFAEIDDSLENKYIIKNQKVYDKFVEEISK